MEVDPLYDINNINSTDYFEDQINVMMSEMKKVCLYFVYIGLGIWFFGALQVFPI